MSSSSRITVVPETTKNELPVRTGAAPERDLWRAGQKRSGTLDEGLYVRLLHVRTEKVLLAGPTLNEHDTRWVVRVLKQLYAETFRLGRKHGGDQCSDLSSCRVGLVRQ